MKTLNHINFQQMVETSDGQPVTTSSKVAKYFKKQHKHVLRDIRNLDCSKEFIESNFGLCFENNRLQNGKRQPYYTITKDGFMFLVMGYRGKEAALIKENYIKAFNWMYQQLNTISKSYMDTMNRLTLQYNQEKSVASFAGKALRKWQLSKPCLIVRMKELEKSGQGQLLLN